MDAIQKIEEALAAGPTEWDYDSNQTPFYNDADGYCRGGDSDGTYCLYGPDFFIDGERYEGPVLTKCCAEKDAKYISATGPSAMHEVLQTLASKEAEIARLKSGQAASLTDDQINDLWIRRDCIEAIQAGDISAQVRCVVRAALNQPTE